MHRGYAPGKLILTGEHSVVHGHRAVALAVSRGTTVTLHDRPGPSGLMDAPYADERLWPALATLLPPEGVGVQIESNLPVGRGMGSSASLAVALVRALAAREGRVADFEECHRQGFLVERVFHGEPSGIDHAVSALGGAVSYRRGANGPEIKALPTPLLQLAVLDTGVAGNTAALVAGVRARRPAIDPILNRMGALSEQIIQQLREAARAPDLLILGELLDENHRLLQQIGVSTPAVDALVLQARAAGARGAKLSGAGGGGVVLALLEEPARVLRVARETGADVFTVTVHESIG